MGMFKWADEDSKGSPLFAGALAVGSAGASPLSEYLVDDILFPSYRSLESEIIGSSGEINLDQIKALKNKMLDKSLRDNFLILPSKDNIGSFSKVTKKYLPARAELESFLRKGGLQTFEGTANPIRAVHAIRDAGGFISLPRSNSHAITLAHELGHATSLNPGSTIRSSRPYNFIDSLGRSLMESGSRNALGAALIAGSFDSDDKKKWLVPGGIGITQAAVLGEEALASYKAMQALKSLKDTPSRELVVAGEGTGKLFAPSLIENAGKSLRRAWGTYGLTAAGLLAAPILAIKAREQWDKGRRN